MGWRRHRHDGLVLGEARRHTPHSQVVPVALLPNAASRRHIWEHGRVRRQRHTLMGVCRRRGSHLLSHAPVLLHMGPKVTPHTSSGSFRSFTHSIGAYTHCAHTITGSHWKVREVPKRLLGTCHRAEVLTRRGFRWPNQGQLEIRINKERTREMAQSVNCLSDLSSTLRIPHNPDTQKRLRVVAHTYSASTRRQRLANPHGLMVSRPSK